ncbi:MAG: hypothetical protein KGL39_34700 [Patescibacteria group bacterium]|nr:hypothetical protein [Patescibacteria group bacterium]
MDAGARCLQTPSGVLVPQTGSSGYPTQVGGILSGASFNGSGTNQAAYYNVSNKSAILSQIGGTFTLVTSFVTKVAYSPHAGDIVTQWGDTFVNGLIQLQVTPSSNLLAYTCQSSGTALGFTGSDTISTGQLYWAVAIADGANFSAYLNGVSQGSVAYDGTLLTNSAPEIFFGAKSTDTGAGVDTYTETFGGTIGPTFLLSRPWSAAEVAQHFSDPWQVIAPAQRRLYFGASGGGTDSLTATDLVDGAPALDNPVIAQVQVLTASDLMSALPLLDNPVFTGQVALTAYDLTDIAPSLDTPAVTQLQVLVAFDLTDALSILDAPTIKQVHVLAADDETSGTPLLDTPVIDYNPGTGGMRNAAAVQGGILTNRGSF